MSEIIVLGVDPALSNVGIALASINLDDNTLEIERIHLVQTESTSSKSVRVNSDDLERARVIWKDLKPFLDLADVVAVELPVGSQSARAMASYGICIGLFATVNKPLIQVTAKQVKLVSGKANATKAQMIQYASTEFPDLPWLTKTQKGVTTLVEKNEHIADAICAVLASLETDEFRLIENSRNPVRKNK